MVVLSTLCEREGQGSGNGSVGVNVGEINRFWVKGTNILFPPHKDSNVWSGKESLYLQEGF